MTYEQINSKKWALMKKKGGYLSLEYFLLSILELHYFKRNESNVTIAIQYIDQQKANILDVLYEKNYSLDTYKNIYQTLLLAKEIYINAQEVK